MATVHVIYNLMVSVGVVLVTSSSVASAVGTSSAAVSVVSTVGVSSTAVASSAGAVAQAEAVMKTWTVTLLSGDGLTNNAPVTLSDGNCRLRGWGQDVDRR